MGCSAGLARGVRFLGFEIGGLWARVRVVAKKAKRTELQKLRLQFKKAEARLTPVGETDFLILQELSLRGKLPATQLADRVGLTSGSMTAALTRLEKKSFLSRERTELDRRRVLVKISKSGKEGLKLWMKEREKDLEKAFADFSKRELDLLTALLRRVGRG